MRNFQFKYMWDYNNNKNSYNLYLKKYNKVKMMRNVYDVK